MLWRNLRDIIANLIPNEYWNMIWPFVNDVPQIVVALLIIAIGIGLIVGKKKEVKDGE